MTTLINRSWLPSSPAQPQNPSPRARTVTGVRTIRVGLLGCGTVGREVAAQLLVDRDRWLKADGVRIDLSHILVRDSLRDRGVDPALLVTQFRDLLNARPDVIIEAVGGIDSARDFVEAALRRGIPVVTANKSLIAQDGERLRSIAERNGVALFCEACVGGAVPILAALKQLRGDRIRSIRGIINGTCNDILGRMTNEELSFDKALHQAIRAGLAEPDPSADVSGRDSAEKLCVLGAASGFGGIGPEQVETTGIDSITAADIDAARLHGHVIKLVAELACENGVVHAHVGPALIPKRSPLARAAGPHNVIAVDAELAGTLILQGAGAGPTPTASAILGDLRRAVGGEAGTIASAPHTADITPTPRPRFVRINRPSHRTSPEQWLGVFKTCGIEIHHIQIKPDAIEAFTGPVRTSVLKDACSLMNSNSRIFIADVMTRCAQGHEKRAV